MTNLEFVYWLLGAFHCELLRNPNACNSDHSGSLQNLVWPEFYDLLGMHKNYKWNYFEKYLKGGFTSVDQFISTRPNTPLYFYYQNIWDKIKSSLSKGTWRMIKWARESRYLYKILDRENWWERPFWRWREESIIRELRETKCDNTYYIQPPLNVKKFRVRTNRITWRG